jgi:hypothetical protein
MLEEQKGTETCPAEGAGGTFSAKIRALDRLHQQKPITELMQGADQCAMEWAATSGTSAMLIGKPSPHGDELKPILLYERPGAMAPALLFS